MSTIPAARGARNYWGGIALGVAILVLAMQGTSQLLAAFSEQATAKMGSGSFSAVMTAIGSIGTVLSLVVVLLSVFGFAQDKKSKLTSAAAFAIALAVLASTIFNAVLIPIAVGG